MFRKVCVVYLQYTNKYQEEGLAVLKPFVKRIFPHLQREVVVVDNSWTNDNEIAMKAGTTLISGDNSLREFSGFDKAVDFLESRAELMDSTAFVFANDTFYRNYGSDYLKCFTPENVSEALRTGGIIGHVDGYPKSVRLLNLEFQKWVRTSLFVLNYKTLRALRPLRIALKDEDVFSTRHQEFFRTDAPLSENYRDYLRTWLFEPVSKGGDFQHEWHSKQQLSEETFSNLKDKAKCIFCEHWFSARAQSLGIPLVALEDRA